MSAEVEKLKLRHAIRARRVARDDDQRAAAGEALAAHADSIEADTVAAFVGVRSEPPTLPLLRALAERGTRVLLPLLREDLDLEWADFDSADTLRAGPRGILQPAGDSLGLDAIAAAGLVLAPGLAVDRQGRRLGQGGGSYDRALARASAPVLVVLFDDEVLDAVPVEPHDRRVDGVLTPTGGLVAFTA
jgi:5-formyltetrahydrofolate cyclo-ligase